MKELEELFEKYPKIFELMKDSYYSISSGVPNAWLQTLDWMCGAIQQHIDNRNEHNKHLEPINQLICEQIKDKYGGLRFYYYGGDEVCKGIVDMAEYILWETCENCGTHDNIITTKGWISRICEGCKDGHEKDKKD